MKTVFDEVFISHSLVKINLTIKFLSLLTSGSFIFFVSYLISLLNSLRMLKDGSCNKQISISQAVLFVLFCFLFFLGPHLRHMEVPRPGVELEL